MERRFKSFHRGSVGVIVLFHRVFWNCNMRIAFYAMLIICCSAAVVEAGDDEIQKLLRNYDDFKRPDQYAEFYRVLFATCKGPELDVLLTHTSDSIATQSAWETVNRTVPIEQRPTVYRPDAQRMAWFLDSSKAAIE